MPVAFCAGRVHILTDWRRGGRRRSLGAPWDETLRQLQAVQARCVACKDLALFRMEIEKDAELSGIENQIARRLLELDDVMRLAELVHYHADVQFEHPYPLDGLLYWLSR